MLDFGHTEPFTRALHDPFERLGQCFTQQQPTGFADGRQAHVSPVLRTVVPQLTHQSTVCQEHEEIPVPSLILATPELIRAHAVR